MKGGIISNPFLDHIGLECLGGRLSPNLLETIFIVLYKKLRKSKVWLSFEGDSNAPLVGNIVFVVTFVSITTEVGVITAVIAVTIGRVTSVTVVTVVIVITDTVIIEFSLGCVVTLVGVISVVTKRTVAHVDTVVTLV